MTLTRAAIVLVVAGLVALAWARWRRSRFGQAFIVAGLTFLAVYALAFAAGDIDCEDRGDCSSSREPLQVVILVALLALVVLPVVAAILEGVRPRPFRTTSGRRRRRPADTAARGRGRGGGAAVAFAPDRVLQARMVLAIAVSACLLAAVVGGLVYLTAIGGWPFTIFIAGFVIAGVVSGRRADLRGRRGARAPRPSDQQRAGDAVRLLCLTAGLTVPEVIIERHRAPLSWTMAGLRRRPHVHLTTGLLDRLSDRELNAVIAHELSHIAQGDAVLMTVLAGPPSAFLRGLRAAIDDDPVRGTMAVLFYGLWLVPVVLLLRASALVVSRHRELTADRGAALLTGSPAAVASALTSVATGLAEGRRRDLRAVRSGDVFHLMPSRRDEPGPLAQVWATHPRLHRRLEQLEAMEERLQA